MVAPDDDVLHISNWLPGADGNLASCAVVIKTCHGGEVPLWDIWGEMGQHSAVGVSRVRNDKYLGSSLADFV